MPFSASVQGRPSDRMAREPQPKELKKIPAFPWLETREESVNTELLGSVMSIHLTKPGSTELARTLDLGIGLICPQEGHRHWDITCGAKKRRT